MKSAYLQLINKVEFLRLKDSQSKTIVLLLTIEDLSEIDAQSWVSFEAKKFCIDVRVAANSKFGWNFLEILLLPISKNVAIEEKSLYLTPRDDNNFSHYKDLVKNDSLRVTMMLFIDQVPGLEMKTLTSRTTLKSFQEDARIIELVKPIKDNAVTQEDRYAFVGLFLESILFEMVDSPRGKRSKSRIVNYIVDLLCRSGM